MRRGNRSVALLVTAALTAILNSAAASAMPAGSVAPIGTSPCPGVRPGADIAVPSAGWSGTLNFLFRGSDGRRYAATAGHLVADEQRLVFRGQGPVVELADGTVIGRFVFASNFNGGFDDIGLIRLKAGVKSDPAMCHWGGPTGINDDLTDDPTVLRLYGKGLGVGEVAPGRTMIAATMANETVVGATGFAISGDSGSPVISEDGRALGIQVAIGFVVGPEGPQGDPAGFSPGNVFVYRLGPQLKIAEEALGMEFELLTAPLAEA